MKLPFPFSLLFPRSASAVMSQFTKAIDELDAIADANFKKATAASNKAEAQYDLAAAKVENLRAAAEARLDADVARANDRMVADLALADEVEEAEIRKVEALDDKWAAHVSESDEARAAANTLRGLFGVPQ